MVRKVLVAGAVVPPLAACAEFEVWAHEVAPRQTVAIEATVTGPFISCVNNFDMDIFNIEHPPG